MSDSPVDPALADPAATDSAPADPAAAAQTESGRPVDAAPPRKGPLSFLSGALTSALLAWLCLGLSQRVLIWYGAHPPHYSSAIAQSIATAMKTLIVGMCFLATFSFLFIGMGLFLTFLRSLLRPAETGSAP
jgi:hypothetical protein